MPDPGFVEDLVFRGLWYQETGSGLAERLRASDVTAYIGFDPTSDSLHVGSLLQICMLRRLAMAGHRPIALVGGGTGMIGDPGGRSDERPLLDQEELSHNLASIRAQLERLTSVEGASSTLVTDNADWLSDLRLVDFLREVGKHFSVNEMIRRESVATRLERAEQGISFTEFSYMLLQAYDFLQLFDTQRCILQLGGSDQFGNILAGVELVRKLRRQEVYGLTSPLVLKADGTKFGKTESGTVWLDPRRTSPFELYQYMLRTEDAVVGRYLRYFTFLEHSEILALDEATALRPQQREAQRVLAREVCTLVHTSAETRRAEEATAALYSQKVASLDRGSLLEVLAEAPATTLPRATLEGEGTPLVDLLVSSGLSASKSAARSVISQGGAYVNDVRESNQERRITAENLLHGSYLVLRRGKQEYHLVSFE